eukprot:scaffold140982_cov36-Tisochrysis_lutea.AAC.2
MDATQLDGCHTPCGFTFATAQLHQVLRRRPTKGYVGVGASARQLTPWLALAHKGVLLTRVRSATLVGSGRAAAPRARALGAAVRRAAQLRSHTTHHSLPPQGQAKKNRKIPG